MTANFVKEIPVPKGREIWCVTTENASLSVAEFSLLEELEYRWPGGLWGYGWQTTNWTMDAMRRLRRLGPCEFDPYANGMAGGWSITPEGRRPLRDSRSSTSG